MLADTARSRHGSLTRHAIGSIDVPTKVGEREAFIHGDPHPSNVLLTNTGPVVIDWEGAGVGSADDVPRLIRPLVGLIRKTVLRAFLKDVPQPRSETIAAVCDSRLRDKNMRPRELDRIRAFKSEHTTDRQHD